MRGISPRSPRPLVLDDAQLKQLEADGRLIHEGFLVTGTAAAPRAVSLRCTHLGCALQLDPSGEALVCPCHRSKFDLNGDRVSGPATRPLDKAKLTLSGERWTIALSRRPAQPRCGAPACEDR